MNLEQQTDGKYILPSMPLKDLNLSKREQENLEGLGYGSGAMVLLFPSTTNVEDIDFRKSVDKESGVKSFLVDKDHMNLTKGFHNFGKNNHDQIDYVLVKSWEYPHLKLGIEARFADAKVEVRKVDSLEAAQEIIKRRLAAREPSAWADIITKGEKPLESYMRGTRH